jgi:hypothetical protein
VTLDHREPCAVRRPLLCLIACAGLFVASPARAVLGGDVATIDDDRVRVSGSMMQPLAVRPGQVQGHEIRMADGSSIREYVAPNGVVFAVAWSTRFKPDLAALLGRHAVSYAAAATDALKTPGIKRAIVLQRDDLVVRSTSHLNTYVGKAYVRALVPAGVDVDALR